MKKTFLFFSAQYLPTSGGVERFTYNLAKNLISHGHRVIVATSALPGLPTRETDDLGIQIFRFPSLLLMKGRLPLIRPNREFRETARALWAQRIDYCVINTYFYPLSMYAASQVSKRGIPALVLNHGSAWLMTGSKPVQLAGQIYERTAAKLCYHYCKSFFGVSLAAQNWMDTLSIPTKGVITNAIDPDEVVRSAAPDTQWRRRLSLPEDAQIIAFVGRMIPEKGVEPLMNAMEEIRRAFPNAFLLMAGEGPLLDKHLPAPPEGVMLLGPQPYPDILALLNQADLFCLPSRSEGFACTVLEAAAMGCPILTTPTGGSPQLLIDRNHGILMRDMSAPTIADSCKQALANPAWRTAAAALTGRRLRENYTWDAAVSQLYSAFSVEKE